MRRQPHHTRRPTCSLVGSSPASPPCWRCWWPTWPAALTGPATPLPPDRRRPRSLHCPAPTTTCRFPPAHPPTSPRRPGAGARTRNPAKDGRAPAHQPHDHPNPGGRMDPISLPEQPHGPYPRPPRGLFIGFDQRSTMLHGGLHGVKLGAFDRRTIDWLCHWCDTPTFLVVLG